MHIQYTRTDISINRTLYLSHALRYLHEDTGINTTMHHYIHAQPQVNSNPVQL